MKHQILHKNRIILKYSLRKENLNYEFIFFLSEIGDFIGMKEDHQMILAMKLTWVIIDTITIMIILIIILKNEISMNTV